MNVQPITTISTNFKGTKTTENGNVYHTTNAATLTGLTTGVLLSIPLIHGKVKSLKTIAGKRNLLEPYFKKGKSLNDLMPRQKDSDGKVIIEKNGATIRSNKIAKRFINSVIGWATLLTGGTTGIGYMLDANTELARSRMADGYIKPANYY